MQGTDAIDLALVGLQVYTVMLPMEMMMRVDPGSLGLQSLNCHFSAQPPGTPGDAHHR